MTNILDRLKGGLIVSVQSRAPLSDPAIIAALAESAVVGGAVGIRADGPANVAAIRARVDVPIIGINKQRDSAYTVYITPTREAATVVIEAGAEIVALDAAPSPRPTGVTVEELIAFIHKRGVLVMADISTLEEGVAAMKAGADIVATTMSGYTPYSRQQTGPDLELVRELAAAVDAPIIAEGRYHTPDEVAAAFESGAFAVVVGRAITEPQLLTQQFVRVTPRTHHA